MKCVAKLTTEDPNPDYRILCDVDTDHIYQGSSLCTRHVIEAFDRTELESGLGGLMKGLEKITLADIAKVRAVVEPLMTGFQDWGPHPTPPPDWTPPPMEPDPCTLTQGCLKPRGHDGGCR